MTFDRRVFLKSLGAGAVATAAQTHTPTMFTAHAAETSGYRALVCVFLRGGVDGHDVVLPYDSESYSRFSNARKTLINRQGGARSRSSLLAINPVNASNYGSRRFALPPEMPHLKRLFDQGNAAIVGNVGPLIEPLTRPDVLNQKGRLPSQLYSHNSQQDTWRSNRPQAAKYGWGGLFADAMLASNANSASPAFTTIATTDAGAFLTGNRALPFLVQSGEAAQFELLDSLEDARVSAQRRALLENVRRIVSNETFTSDHIIERDIANIVSRGFAANKEYEGALESARAFDGIFANDLLSQQLETVAKTIAVRGTLLAERQVFYVGLGGFDTHSNQANDLSTLLRAVDNGLNSFYTAMSQLGLANDVVTFTASEFGRTLTANGDGTDHGWGNHHFVIGGGVTGRQIYGHMPETGLNHQYDAGRGRLIPAYAVEQYAGALGKWFGLSDSDLSMALPALRNFSTGPLPLFTE